jgi:choline dehydrogenase-like flavoprotein
LERERTKFSRILVMIIDLEQPNIFPQGEVSNFDVCIVGAGAAGLILAIELINHGKRVLVLESGGLRRWERRTQALKMSEILGLPYAGVHSGRFRALGGTTTVWAGQIAELSELDFAHRSWVPGSGWPIKKSDLAAGYARALELEGLAGSIQEDRVIWSERACPPPDLGDELTLAFSRYCPERKFAYLFEKTINSHPDLMIYLHANACELTIAEDGQTVTSVRCRTLTGKEQHFAADRFVLCLGGIETSRFLLQPYARGPWTRNRFVGRHFQDHIHCFGADLSGAKLNQNWHYGPHRIDVHGYLYLPKINLSPAAQERYGVLNASGMAEYEDGVYPVLRIAILMLAGPVSAITFRDLVYSLPRMPAALLHHFARKINPKFILPMSRLKLSVYCEQSPLSESRIALTDERDVLGMYRSSIDWRVSSQEVETVRRYVQVARQVFEQRGLGLVEPDPNLFHDRIVHRFGENFHHMGGTRMAGSALEGVVDPDLRIFGTRNAYVCSTSIFPTSGFANPTHTLLALAVRLAWHLKDLPTVRQQL